MWTGHMRSSNLIPVVMIVNAVSKYRHSRQKYVIAGEPSRHFEMDDQPGSSRPTDRPTEKPLRANTRQTEIVE